MTEELKSEEGEAYNNKGLEFAKLQQYDKAIWNYNKALELDPSNEDALFFKGTILVILNKYEEAILCFDKIPEKGERYIVAQHSKGMALARLNKSEEAISYFDKVPDNCRNYVEAQCLKGMLLMKLNKYEEAILCFDKVPDNSESYVDAQYYKGFSFLLLDKAKDAANSFVNAKKESFFILSEFNYLSNICKIENVISKIIDYNDNDFFNIVTKPKRISNKEKEDYKKIYTYILQIIYLLHVKNETVAAHYTKRATAAQLLFKNSKFRLNSTITANDPQEGETLLKYFKLEETCKNKNEESQNEGIIHDYQAFIGCFTFNHESLNQFRLYGKESDKEATGISLVLNKDFFNEKMDIGLLSNCFLKDNDKENVNVKDERTQKYALYRCIYVDPKTHKVISLGHKEEYSFYRENFGVSSDEVSTYNKEINKIKSKVTNQLKKLDKSIKTGKDLDKNIICELLLPLRYLVKHVAYKEEQECRIFDIKDLQEDKLKERDKREVKFTPDYAQMFIEYQPIIEYVEKVIFAPKTEGIEIFKKAAEQKGLNVKCDVSTHPFS